MRLERTFEERVAGVSSCSQPTVDYDLHETRSKQWDEKIDHMDSYLAELGAGHLQLRDSISEIKKQLRSHARGDHPTEESGSRELTQAVQSLQKQVEEMDRKTHNWSMEPVAAEAIRLLENK
eukprot:2388825-Amphidinium_carterae.1